MVHTTTPHLTLHTIIPNYLSHTTPHKTHKPQRTIHHTPHLVVWCVDGDWCMWYVRNVECGGVLCVVVCCLACGVCYAAWCVVASKRSEGLHRGAKARVRGVECARLQAVLRVVSIECEEACGVPRTTPTARLYRWRDLSALPASSSSEAMCVQQREMCPPTCRSRGSISARACDTPTTYPQSPGETQCESPKYGNSALGNWLIKQVCVG